MIFGTHSAWPRIASPTLAVNFCSPSFAVQTLTKLPISRTVRDRQLEELQELGLVENNPTWKLTERAQELLAAAQLA